MVLDPKHPEKSLTEKQLAFIEWKVDPERAGSQADWCRANDVGLGTPRTWRDSPFFKAAYEKRLRELNVSTERIQSVIDAMHKKATEGAGDVIAMKAYMEYAKWLQPNLREEPEAPSGMSDAELAAALDAAADQLRAHT